MTWTVYILYSGKLDSFYKGHTNNIIDRLRRHNNRQEDFTSKGVPWRLIWTTNKNSKAEAYQLELKIKNLSRARTINFISKFSDGVEGADELLLLQQLSAR
ncbi:MAG TPA: GIY-YIG nuclease family protein [Bacteroidia bacterium]